jgi:hypothetical protein
MRIALYYPRLGAGGCEKRLAELGSYLLRRGDEVWIVAAALDGDIPVSIICGQGGFPLSRILLAPPGMPLQSHLLQVCAERRIELVDVQWVEPLPEALPCAFVYTTHGLTQPLPNRRDFAGAISVDALPRDAPHFAFAPRVLEVWNWVNLARFPFDASLGEGVAFFGRSFKMWPNVIDLARSLPAQTIDAYGFLVGGMEHVPPNVRWLGYVDAAERLYRYRIVLASAQAALEALAAGRLLICGHDQGGFASDARLVMPDDLPRLSGRQFWFADAHLRAGAVTVEFDRACRADFAEERLAIRRYLERCHDLDTQCATIRAFYERCVR